MNETGRTRKKGTGNRSEPEAGWGPKESLSRIRAILVRKGLLDAEEELSEAMLEDLVHYAYFTGCITKGEVRRFLGLSSEQARDLIRSWKRWQDGTRSCQLRQNPLYEDWIAARDE